MEVTFREYTDKDKPQLLALAQKLAAFHKTLDPIQRIKNAPGFVEMDIEEALANVKKYRGKIWFAEEDGKTIGFIIGVIWKQAEKNELEVGKHLLGEVLDLYIEEAYRGQGLGSKMLAKMESYFKSNGCDSMSIRLFAPNERAHKTYKKFGFVDRSVGMLKTI